MPGDRRPFRIEADIGSDDGEQELRAAGEQGDYGALFERVFVELADIRRLVQRGGYGPPPDGGQGKAELMAEVESIQQAISQTKREILSLQVKGLRGDAASRALDELDAVVHGTEVATETILSSAESIEEVAGKLLPKLQGSENALVLDIHKHAIRIFEACNFQDLTGQRIAKVVQVLHFIEDRVETIMSIWGGAESFSSIPAAEMPAPPEKTGDAALLNGPPLETDQNVVSQDDIDSLFA
ncbi:protein phosphatase CheZ [Pseudochelatococcus sp. B33]